MATPLEPQDLPIHDGHKCQTDCGRLADIVIIGLSDSTVDIFCNPCALMMWLAVAEQIPAPDQAEPLPAGSPAG